MGNGGHSKTVLVLELFVGALLKSFRLLVGMSRHVVGGPCNNCVSLSPKNWGLGFFTLRLEHGCRSAIQFLRGV